MSPGWGTCGRNREGAARGRSERLLEIDADRSFRVGVSEANFGPPFRVELVKRPPFEGAGKLWSGLAIPGGGCDNGTRPRRGVEPRLRHSGTWRSLASALDWGSRGRRFKSCRPDYERSQLQRSCGLFCFPCPDNRMQAIPGDKRRGQARDHGSSPLWSRPA